MISDSKIYMQRCIELAKLGERRVAPNPMVGCVVVTDGKIIGEGFHQKYGEPHAEVNAINSVRNKYMLHEFMNNSSNTQLYSCQLQYMGNFQTSCFCYLYLRHQS